MLEGSPDVLGLSQGKGIGSRLGKVAARECSGIVLVLGERHTSVRPDKPQTVEPALHVLSQVFDPLNQGDKGTAKPLEKKLET